jgi:hypothetical protein
LNSLSVCSSFFSNSSKTSKEKLQEYKERKQIGGVYAIKNSINGKILLLSTADLKGIKNRFEFSIATNNCINHKLQKDWNEFGKNVFSFEVLEELS